MANKLYNQVYKLINQYNRILIMPSSPPDGDALGSALALYLVLKKLGKEVTVVCADPVPEAFQFLPTANVVSNQFSASSDFIVTLDCSKAEISDIKANIENDKVNIIVSPKSGMISEKSVSFNYGATNYELIIVVDTGDLEQLGRFYEENTEIFTRIPVINIDHHISNSNFGVINLVDIMAPSATEIIMHLIESFPKGRQLIDEDVATLLLAGIITDTNSFQNANTSPRAFAAAGHLSGYGARQQEIIRHVYKTKNLSTLKLWGRVLSKLKTDDKHKMVWSTISLKDFEETQSHVDETGDIIDELMTNAPGAEIVMLIKEKQEGLVSVSVRTTHAGVDASEIAEYFGGGGHVQAAGFRIHDKSIIDAEQEIVDTVKNFQSERLFLAEEDESELMDTNGVALLDIQDIIKKDKPDSNEFSLLGNAEFVDQQPTTKSVSAAPVIVINDEDQKKKSRPEVIVPPQTPETTGRVDQDWSTDPFYDAAYDAAADSDQEIVDQDPSTHQSQPQEESNLKKMTEQFFSPEVKMPEPMELGGNFDDNQNSGGTFDLDPKQGF